MTNHNGRWKFLVSEELLVGTILGTFGTTLGMMGTRWAGLGGTGATCSTYNYPTLEYQSRVVPVIDQPSRPDGAERVSDFPWPKAPESPQPQV